MEERELRLAEDLHPGGHDPVEVPHEGEPRFLDASVADRAVEPRLTGDEVQLQTEARVLDERPYAHDRRRWRRGPFGAHRAHESTALPSSAAIILKASRPLGALSSRS